jgi:hypothetical protein
MMRLRLIELRLVATVLDRLPQPVVYTGGATIPLYLDALSARDTIAPAFLAASDSLTRGYAND